VIYFGELRGEAGFENEEKMSEVEERENLKNRETES
jgi:hypothetical protein